MNGYPLDFANIASWLATLVVLVACILLWMRRKNAWTLLALAGQAAIILCHVTLLTTPSAFATYPQLRIAWPLAGLAFAVGLAGYAWTEFDSTRGGGSNQGTVR